MKYYRILFLAAALTGLASCAVDPLKEYEVEKPQAIAQYEYLNDYDVLKNYVSSAASPDFKLGAALAVNDFLAKNQVYSLAVSNFDEMTAGNAMKYSSVVDNNGNMNFVNVKNFVSTAEAAGMTVYGHTLAWHSQQNNKYLTSLIADQEMDSDGTMVVDDNAIYWSDYTSYPHYVMGYTPEIVDGILVSTYPGSWYQYFVLPDFPTDPKYTYTVTAKLKGSKAGQLTVQMGNWDPEVRITSNMVFTDEWTEQSVKISGLSSNKSFVVFQPGTFDGTIEIEWIKVTHEEAMAVEVETDINFMDYPKDGPFPFYAMGCEPPIIGGYLHYEPTGDWNQFFVMPGAYNQLSGGKYAVYLTMKANKAASNVMLTMQNGWAATDQKLELSVPVREGEHEYRLVFDGIVGGAYDVILKPQTADVILDVKSVRVCLIKNMNAIPLTPEEKKDTLTWAMDNWIKGMMEATAGKVVAWDVVNEAVSGTDGNGDGKYDLQSAANGDPANNFYWQDYLGDEDYVRIVVAKARQYFEEFGGNPSDLKLFINDYNLESDWDDNKKLKSLIQWIKIWESDGVTKLDGIATQMHVSCYENPQVQASKQEHVVEMFKLMAATGKLVKISELDMGYIDANGNTVPTTSMTEAQHKAMAEYYKFIVSEYFKNVPAAQQYGITQWCLTDAPGELGTGCRGGEPVGLWDQSYNRKHAYAGFAAGLKGE